MRQARLGPGMAGVGRARARSPAWSLEPHRPLPLGSGSGREGSLGPQGTSHPGKAVTSGPGPLIPAQEARPRETPGGAGDWSPVLLQWARLGFCFVFLLNQPLGSRVGSPCYRKIHVMEMYDFKHLKVYTSMTFSTFTNCDTVTSVQNIFTNPKGDPMPVSVAPIPLLRPRQPDLLRDLPVLTVPVHGSHSTWPLVTGSLSFSRVFPGAPCAHA